MRIHTITDTDNVVETIDFRVDRGQYALVHKIINPDDEHYKPKTIIMNQREALINLHNAIHEEEELLKKKGERNAK